MQSERAPGDAFATAIFAVIGPDGEELHFTSAGHPPPLVVGPNGRVEFLQGGLATPLGVTYNGQRPAASARLEPGSLLLLYTDGLVERRNSNIADGLDRLARAAHTATRDPEAFCDAVLEQMLGSEGPPDDVALLAVATKQA